MRHFFFFFLVAGATLVHGGTSPRYTVTEVQDPPSKFETNQVDGLDFLPGGRMVVYQSEEAELDGPRLASSNR